MRRPSYCLLMLLAAMLLATVICGCDSTGVIPPNPPGATAAFASLRADGGVLTSARMVARSRTARLAAMRAAKDSRAARGIAPKDIGAGVVNIYVWSKAAMGAERKVTPEALDAVSVHLSADGTKGVFTAYNTTDDYSQVYLGTIPAAGEAPTDAVQLTTNVGDKLSPQISPDGTQVVYVWSGDVGENDRLCLVSTSGGAPNCINFAEFAPARYGHPAWVSNSKIVFEAWDCWNDCTEGQIIDNIFTANTNGSSVTQITDNTGNYDYDMSPSANSNGTKIVTAYYPGGEGDYIDLYLIDLNTLERTPLTNGNATGTDSFDPLFVGDQIVFVAEMEADQSYRLYVMPASGGAATAISPATYDNFFDWDWYDFSHIPL